MVAGLIERSCFWSEADIAKRLLAQGSPLTCVFTNETETG